MPTNIETIRAALLGIVSKAEREEALAALDEVERVIELAEYALDTGMELIQCRHPESVDGHDWKWMRDALAEIKKLKGK